MDMPEGPQVGKGFHGHSSPPAFLPACQRNMAGPRAGAVLWGCTRYLSGDRLGLEGLHSDMESEIVAFFNGCILCKKDLF